MKDINKSFVKKTVTLSLILQIVTGIVSLHGFFVKIPKKDNILKDILGMETIVQFVEFAFYIWMSLALLNVEKMASRRYIDWVITTPVMLISTIIFMKYNYNKEQNKERFTLKDFFQDDRDNVIKLVIYNLGMLVFGYLGENNIIPKYLGITIGFIFFFLAFKLIYTEYAVNTSIGKKLFYFMFIIWSLYGVVAVMPPNIKNTSYNILDIIAKNFYGLFIYYRIVKISCEESNSKLCNIIK